MREGGWMKEGSSGSKETSYTPQPVRSEAASAALTETTGGTWYTRLLHRHLRESRVRNGELLTSYELDSDAKIILGIHSPFPATLSALPCNPTGGSSPQRHDSWFLSHEQARKSGGSLFTRESAMDLRTS